MAPRPSNSYRGARRHQCFVVDKGVWGPGYYYADHRANYMRKTVLSRTPSRYHPIKAMRDYAQSVGAKMSVGATKFSTGIKSLVRLGSRKGARGT